MLDKFKKLFGFFKKEKVDLKLEDVKSRIYKSDRSVINEDTISSSEAELKKTKDEKKEIESRKVSDKNRNTLAELNGEAMMNILDIYKNRK